MKIYDYPHDACKQPVIDYLLSLGFIQDHCNLVYAFDPRDGHDFTNLEFYPLMRVPNDEGWDAIVGHHASGTNPRLVIGTCEDLGDVQNVYELIKSLSGYVPMDDRRRGVRRPQVNA